ncbi:hypothetical protein RJ55_05273 [Drechmeria coniospora]|nr:hypothetical protein RJ55_05273 [Drechmeria coniospora]
MTLPDESTTSVPLESKSQGSQAAADEEPTRFSPDEEAALVAESRAIKADANALFSSRQYRDALARYDDAVASCPRYLHYERAVVQSNMAACHLKLEQWTEAAKLATAAIDGLLEHEKRDADLSADVSATSSSTTASATGSRASGNAPSSAAPGSVPGKVAAARVGDDVEEEIVSPGALTSAPAPPSPVEPSPSPLEIKKADVLRIRTKALLRRARARSEAGGWQNLAAAEEDYRTLSGMRGLAPADVRTVKAQLKALPPKTKAAQESEMAEMWGKLRNLGDGILKPFGLSTNNFKMVKDEQTGGYSMNFQQGGPSSS